jgi:Ca2+/Na+ antiporter
LEKEFFHIKNTKTLVLYLRNMGMDVLKIVAGLVGLIVGGEWLLRAAVGTSNRFAIPKFIIGMTVVSFATSLPELIVSVRSALAGYPDLALGMWWAQTLPILVLYWVLYYYLPESRFPRAFISPIGP